MAGRFALKESVAKALGTGFCKNLSWSDIEIRNDAQGKPTVLFSPTATHAFNLSQSAFFVSMSHCRKYATAFAIWTLNQNEFSRSQRSEGLILTSQVTTIQKYKEAG